MFNKSKIEALSSRVRELEELQDNQEPVKQEDNHARCKLCGVTDFKDNLVKITYELEVGGKARGYAVSAGSSAGSVQTIGMRYFYGPTDYVHAKCMDITPSDDNMGWNFKKKPLPVKEESK